MLNWLRALARFFQDKIGWNRIGVLLSLTIIGVAAMVLFHMLRDIDVDQVNAAIKATKPYQIAAAALFVAGGYFTLTFYDWFALRTIGRSEIPYRVAALAGFTSYSIGHNIGATVFTGGAVRYRIYSGYGLDAVEVAKICFIAGLTFWLGNATVLGLGVLHSPQAATPIDRLPAWVNRDIAIALLLVLASYVGWVWSAPRVIGQRDWQVRLPNGPSTLVQIVIGIFDLGCCAHGDVHAAADRAEYRLRRAGGGVRVGDAARLCQPRARRSRRVRRRHAGGAVAIRQGRRARRIAAVPAALLSFAVRDRARYSGHARDLAELPARQAASGAESAGGHRADPQRNRDRKDRRWLNNGH